MGPSGRPGSVRRVASRRWASDVSSRARSRIRCWFPSTIGARPRGPGASSNSTRAPRAERAEAERRSCAAHDRVRPGTRPGVQRGNRAETLTGVPDGIRRREHVVLYEHNRALGSRRDRPRGGPGGPSCGAEDRATLPEDPGGPAGRPSGRRAARGRHPARATDPRGTGECSRAPRRDPQAGASGASAPGDPLHRQARGAP